MSFGTSNSISQNLLSKLKSHKGNTARRELSAAVTKTRAKASGEIIGMTALAPKTRANASYVAAAHVASDYARENPFVHVDINSNNYRVRVNSVNPKRASLLEMFAICAYADHVGITQREVFDTFSQFKQAANYAAVRGYGCVNDFIYDATDWESIIGAVENDYLNHGAYDQYLQCLRLMDLFDYQLLKAM